jgi:hypothetical protein
MIVEYKRLSRMRLQAVADERQALAGGSVKRWHFKGLSAGTFRAYG